MLALCSVSTRTEQLVHVSAESMVTGPATAASKSPLERQIHGPTQAFLSRISGDRAQKYGVLHALKLILIQILRATGLFISGTNCQLAVDIGSYAWISFFLLMKEICLSMPSFLGWKPGP